MLRICLQVTVNKLNFFFAQNVLWILYIEGSFIKVQTSSTSTDNEYYNEWQRMTKSDNELQRVVQRMTTSDNEWQRGTISASFSFFRKREEATTKHPKENSLNIEEDLWRRPIELRAGTSP